MAGLLAIAVATVGVAVFAYTMGWSHGRASGKVAALEAELDVDLSADGGENDAE